MSWPLVRLGEVAPSKPLKNPQIIDENSVWQLNLDKVQSQSGIVIEKVYDSVESAGSSTHWFDERNVLYSKLRPYLNKVVLPDEQGLATTELVPLCPDENRLDRKYLAYYLRSNRFVSWISDQVAGAKMPRVSMKVFWEHQIPLPPLEEQKRIAAILDKADCVRRKRQQAIDLADDFLRSVFLDMFGDPFINPKGWEVKALNDISLGKGVYGSGKPAVNYSEGDYRYIRITDITSTGDLKEKMVSLQDSEQESQKYLLKDGDLLFARSGATVGKTFLYSSKYGRCIYAGYLIKFSINRDIALPEFIKAFTDTSIYWNWIRSKQKVVAQPNINAKQYGEELEIPVPPKELQMKFVGIWKKVNESKEKWINTIDGELVQSLSQKAFSAEL
ncbi:restriction endonuclease subunit S [Pseudoalteromonas rhizosphaerae]|uniref:restriction endonuclease subunit S n=1 Tax=Pseudoalteromonas rhizosphaerae TaxID=2518973 RepID=UPI0012312EC5|nr:restriction endonuclease subunit S [Pseudoalteromonas rhizosphaerae]